MVKKRKIINRPEQDICAGFMKIVYLLENQYDCLRDLYHIPNEGKRPDFLCNELGIKGGISDYHLPHRTERYLGFWLEIKVPGREPTSSQWQWAERMRKAGHYFVWCDTIDSAILEIKTYAKAVELYRRKNK